MSTTMARAMGTIGLRVVAPLGVFFGEGGLAGALEGEILLTLATEGDFTADELTGPEGALVTGPEEGTVPVVCTAGVGVRAAGEPPVVTVGGAGTTAGGEPAETTTGGAGATAGETAEATTGGAGTTTTGAEVTAGATVEAITGATVEAANGAGAVVEVTGQVTPPTPGAASGQWTA